MSPEKRGKRRCDGSPRLSFEAAPYLGINKSDKSSMKDDGPLTSSRARLPKHAAGTRERNSIGSLLLFEMPTVLSGDASRVVSLMSPIFGDPGRMQMRTPLSYEDAIRKMDGGKSASEKCELDATEIERATHL